MLGFTRTGCFFIGVVVGVILALALTLFIVFLCDAGVGDSVRRIWSSVKSGVDRTLGAPPKRGAAPPREPQIPQARRPVPAKEVPPPAPGTAAGPRTVKQVPPRTMEQVPPRAAEKALPRAPEKAPPRARIEINL